ncbi:cuticle protein 6 [Agrilus planipennis]|uniref:Cuticle protein 6 n=1 Tax=Agrilus planipennis TaxID=224129 RepID=A0A1W4WEB0_AGRPL|nr:cuticle protein 6 [Agrilus planipennis]
MGHLKQLSLIIFSLFATSMTYVLKTSPVQIEQSFLDWSQYNAYKESSHTGTYSFGYDIQDLGSNNVQFKNEMRHPNGTVTGSYGYVESDGNIHMTHYIADESGYRAIIEDSDRLKKRQMFPPAENTKENELVLSPQMLAAIETKKLFNAQSPFENHQRPVDNINNEESLQSNHIVDSTTQRFPVLYPKYQK